MFEAPNSPLMVALTFSPMIAIKSSNSEIVSDFTNCRLRDAYHVINSTTIVFPVKASENIHKMQQHEKVETNDKEFVILSCTYSAHCTMRSTSKFKNSVKHN